MQCYLPPKAQVSSSPGALPMPESRVRVQIPPVILSMVKIQADMIQDTSHVVKAQNAQM